jgi:hypothetical protein
MAFEIFTETGTRTKEFISVTETKAFGLSRAFLDKYKVTGDHKAVILFDADVGKIALHFSTNNPKFGFAVRVSNAKHGATIIAKSFFELKGIDSRRYAGRYSDFDVVSLADLGQEKEGEAFVITLKADSKPRPTPEPVRAAPATIIDELYDDEPINPDDIPF